MPSRLNPYISFPGTCAMCSEFYQRVFGGSLTLMTFAETGAADIPEADQIIHGMLEPTPATPSWPPTHRRERRTNPAATWPSASAVTMRRNCAATGTNCRRTAA